MQETIYALQLNEEDFTFTIYTCTLHKYNADKSTYITSINGNVETFTLATAIYNNSVQEMDIAHTDRKKDYLKRLEEREEEIECFASPYLLCTSLQEGMQYLLEQKIEDVRTRSSVKEKRIQKTISSIQS